MLQHVLAVARAVLEPAYELHQLMMQPVYAYLEYSLLACLAYLSIYLAARLLNHLFYAGRMYASVGYEALQRNSRDLTANRIKAGKYYGLRRIVDYEVDTRRSFQRAYVASLSADYATLHFVIRQRHD